AVPEESAGSGYGLYLSSLVADARGDFFYLVGNYGRAVKNKAGDDFLNRLYIREDINGDKQGALRKAKSARAPERAAASIYVASRELASGRIREALSALGGINPGIISDILKSWLLISDKRPREAARALMRHIDPRDAFIPAMTSLALVYAQTGGRENADVIYKTALRYRLDPLDLEQIAAFYGPAESPGILEAHYKDYPSESLADLLSAMKKGYRPAAADTPQKGFALSLLKISNSILNAGDDSLYDNAFLYANQALALWPGFYAANLARARIFLASNRGADFAAEIAMIPEGSWLFGAARIMKANYCMSRGETRLGIEAYEDAIESNPALLGPYLAIGRHYFSKGDNREAVKILSLGAARGKGAAAKAYIFYLRSLAYEQMDDFANALSDLERAAALAPSEPAFLNSYGYFLVDRGVNVDKGTRLIEKALRMDRDNPNYVDSFGWALFKQGNLKDAALLLQYAKLLNPTNAVICDHLASVYWMQGREAEARFEWNKALHYYKDSDKFENLTPSMIRERLENGYEKK
ncbi:MAG: hypothetical protein LBT92_01435, partial [Rickettsiales bacterium]|nr:hypothetical protein [Rickettsiales bacterium]